MRSKKEWFGEWFNSPYYHILYKDRDNTEARVFIDNLIDNLDFNKNDFILDLACGKGRHSIYLNNRGFNLVGVDLSPSNVEEAKKYENDRLKFFVHDMREKYAEQSFDFVLNMFTSFGYFDTNEENLRVITNVKLALKPRGKLVLDFLNPYKVIHQLNPNEVKQKNGIDFNISKKLDEKGFIIKTIEFNDRGEEYCYYEKVKAIRKAEFLNYFDVAGLRVIDTFGDYELNQYDRECSERMIFIVQNK